MAEVMFSCDYLWLVAMLLIARSATVPSLAGSLRQVLVLWAQEEDLWMRVKGEGLRVTTL